MIEVRIFCDLCGYKGIIKSTTEISWHKNGHCVKDVGPDLTCFVCGKELNPPRSDGEVWTCPDEDCDAHLGDVQ